MKSRLDRWILAAGLALAAAGGRAELRLGDELPDLGSLPAAGQSVPATKGCVVLVDFWASWCAPCRASFPAYSRLQRDLGPAGLVVVGVGVDKSADAYARFVARNAPAFATVHDADQRLVSRVQVPAMPTAYLFDRHNRLRYVHRGFHGERSEEEMRSEITRLLQEKE